MKHKSQGKCLHQQAKSAGGGGKGKAGQLDVICTDVRVIEKKSPGECFPLSLIVVDATADLQTKASNGHGQCLSQKHIGFEPVSPLRASSAKQTWLKDRNMHSENGILPKTREAKQRNAVDYSDSAAGWSSLCAP